MRKLQVIGAILFFSITCLASNVIGAGIEPPLGLAPVADCDCMAEFGQPDVKIKGPYQRGTFTISNGPENNSIGLPLNLFVSHLFLRWGHKSFLSPTLNFSGGAESICQYTDEEIAALIEQQAVVCYLETEEAFGQEGIPVIKKAIITKRNCPAEGEPNNIFDDIVRGRIVVGIIPTDLVLDEDGMCVGAPPE